MLKFLGYLFFLFVSLSGAAMGEQPGMDADLLEEIESGTLHPFFNALKNGNAVQLSRYMGGEKLKQANLPKHEDKEYEKFLREYYRDAVFTIKQVSAYDELIVVDVEIDFSGRGKKETQFYLQPSLLDETGSDGMTSSGSPRRWRITSQSVDRVRVE
jgi:hypothetical protein